MDLQDYFEYESSVLVPIADSDITQTVHLINEAYKYQDEAKGELRVSTQKLKHYVATTQFYVVKVNDHIEGCVYLEPNVESLHFGLLAVSKPFRGTGLATAIMQAIEDYAVAHEYKTIGLAYMSLAPWLKSYYEKYGYIETGEVTDRGAIKLVWMHKTLL